MLKISNLLCFSLLCAFFNPVIAASVPDKIALACTLSVEVSPITRTVVRMTPFRGVNLIFPEKLYNESTIYSLSSNEVWSYTKASGTNIVPITYKTKDNVFGEIQDLTIATEDHVYSIALVSEPDIKKHCTNVIFRLSAAEKKRLELKKHKSTETALTKNYKEKLANLEGRAVVLSLQMVSEVALSKPSISKIFEESTLQFKSGSLVVYVDRLMSYENFHLMIAEIKNTSRSESVSIDSLYVANFVSGIDKPVPGYMTEVDSIDKNKSIKITFASAKNLSDMDKKLILKTNKGTVSVEW